MDDKQEQARELRINRAKWIFVVVVFSAPVIYSIWRFAKTHRELSKIKGWAITELAKPQPSDMAYGELGLIYLDEGRLGDALPLLAKAAEIEARGAKDTRDQLAYARALGIAKRAGLPMTSLADRIKVLERALSIAPKLAQGSAAATFFGVGLQYQEMGDKTKTRACFSEAVSRQPDDWVILEDGSKERRRGLASYYAKTLAAAELE